MSLQAAKIAELASGILHGNPNATVNDVSSINNSQPNTLSFLGDARETAQLAQTKASIVLIPEACDLGQISFVGEALIVTDDPFTSFIQLLPHFRQSAATPKPGIHPTATVDPTASVAEDAFIGPHVCVGAGSRIGAGSRLYANASIGENVSIGENCIIHPNVVVYSQSVLKDRVILQSGCVIGADGFGYQFRQGAFEKIEHFGSVILEEDVEIGACSTVDRGMFESTVIGRGTKIDNQVMIAHNCRIGEHNVIVSQVGLAGSVTTGNYCRFGGQVGIADHIHIGEGASLMAQAGVFRDVPAGETILGSPALPQEQQKKIMMAQIKLPELRQNVRRLQKEMKALQRQLENANEQDSPEQQVRSAA